MILYFSGLPNGVFVFFDKMQEKLLELIFPDGNYLRFFNWLIPVLEREAVLLARAGKEEEAMEKLRAYCDAEIARDSVNMPPEPIPYTTPLFDRLKQTNDAPLIVSSLSLPARLCHFLYGPDFAPLRERDDFKALCAELEEDGSSRGRVTSRE